MIQGRSHIRVVSAELAVGGRYLITQRTASAVLPLLWEFPGGRVRDGEEDATALRRCLRERVGLEVEVGELTMEVTHAYESYTLTLAVYHCAAAADAPEVARPRSVADVAWVSPDGFGAYTFPGADQQTVDALVAALDD